MEVISVIKSSTRKVHIAKSNSYGIRDVIQGHKKAGKEKGSDELHMASTLVGL